MQRDSVQTLHNETGFEAVIGEEKMDDHRYLVEFGDSDDELLPT